MNKVRLRALFTIEKGMAFAARLGGVDVGEERAAGKKRSREERDSSEELCKWHCAEFFLLGAGQRVELILSARRRFEDMIGLRFVNRD